MTGKITSYLAALAASAASFLCAHSQPVLHANTTTSARWIVHEPFYDRAFAENKGQFQKVGGAAVRYGMQNDDYAIFFHDNGFSLRISKIETRKKAPPFEKENEQPAAPTFSDVSIRFAGISGSSGIAPGNEVNSTFGWNGIQSVHAFRKINFKDLYPGIAAEFCYNETRPGVKYTFEVAPGADASVIHYTCEGADKLFLDQEGNLHIATAAGELQDRAPEAHDADGIPVGCGFVLNGNEISFRLAPYNHSKKIFIDPWVINPGFTAQNIAFDVARDGSGNVYAYGGQNPWKLKKFSSSGTLIWTYNTTYTQWYGDLAVDPAGNSYITEGCCGGGMMKISPGNTVLWNQNYGVQEFWCLAFNCDFTNLYLAQGYASAPFTAQSISNVNMNTGAVSGAVSVAGSEPRALGWGPNGNMYMLVEPGTVVGVNNSFTTLFSIPSGYALAYNGPTYANGVNPTSGQNGVAAGLNFFCTTDGATLYKRNLATGASLGSLAIPGGSPEGNSGIMIDACDYIYVGSANVVYKYDANLNLVSSAATPATVYCLYPGLNGEIIASGNTFIATLAMGYSTTNFSLTASGNSSSCSGCSGTATVNASFNCNSAPLTYQWSTGATTQSVSNLCPGTYTVVVKSLGCMQDTAYVTISGSSGLSVTASQTNILCNGQCTGTATATPTCGTTPYTYGWTGGQTTQVATGLCAGTYTVTVTDVTTATATATVTIVQPSPLTSSISSTNSLCNSPTGTATASPSGGTTGYTYAWNNGQTSQTATGLGTGTYTVTITDANGCTLTQSMTVNCTTSFMAAIQGTCTKMCLGGCQSVQVNITGGTSPYTYVWTPNIGNGPGPYSVCPTTTTSYTCLVIDANNDTANGGSCLVTIWPTYTGVTITGSNPACAGGTGSATANPNGATAPFTYSWSNGQSAQTATGLGAGTYTVTVTDANGCTATQTILITVPSPLSASASSSPACGNGTATVLATGGTSPYTYSWSPSGGTNSSASGLSSGTYTCTVTDANGCTQTVTVNVVASPNPSASLTSTTTSMGPGGSATLTASGGGTYLWSNGQTGSSITVSPAQTTVYCVVVTNSFNCTDSACVTITVIEPPCNLQTLSTLIPNAFSPNSDGINDRFCVPANACIASFTLTIYDRWGEKVFESSSLADCWEGTYKGKILNSGVFAYYFNAVLSNGDTFKQKGNISLLK